MTTEIIIALIGILTGGGVTGVVAWRASIRKAEGEATQTEAEAMKSVQDVYQQALTDQQQYIKQLRKDRNQIVSDREEIRRDNDGLRKRLNELDKKIRLLEKNVDRNNKLVTAMRPFLCGRLDCPNRTNVNLGDCAGGE